MDNVKEYLKQNLRIIIRIDRDYEGDSLMVRLDLEGEPISEDFIYLEELSE